MILAILLTAAYLTLGFGIAFRAGGAPSLAETALRAIIGGIGAWVAVSWALAFACALTPWTLGGAALAAAVGGALLLRARPARDGAAAEIGPWTLALIAPLVLWTVFVCARSLFVPAENHDAIAYHLPRAVMFMLDRGYRFHGEVNEPRLTSWPANYELLLANVIILGQSDAGTVVFGVLSYLGLCLVGAALAERWWGRSDAALATAALIGATPLLILHSGAHKNDLLFALFAAAAMTWAYPFAHRGRLADGLYCVVATGLTIGTKAHGLLVGLACAAFLLAGLRRLPNAASRVQLLMFGLASALLLGGAVFVANVVHTGSPQLGNRTFVNPPGALFGDWSNLWRFPLVLLAAPVTSSHSLWVWWSPSRYRWTEFDLFTSHYGAVFTLAVLAIPVLLLAERRFQGLKTQRDRLLSLGALLAAFAVLLPVRTRIEGWVFSEARYFLAIVPFFLAWATGGLAWLAAQVTSVPRFDAASRAARIASVAAVSLWLSRSLVLFGGSDAYAPLDYVWAVARSEAPVPEPPVQFASLRAGYLLDRLAGPREAVTVDLGYDTWLYPAFGRDFLRPVHLLDTSKPGPVILPEDTTWVLIDRGYLQIAFGANDLSIKNAESAGTGTPDSECFKLLHQLEADRSFQVVYHDPTRNQAIFHRVSR